MRAPLTRFAVVLALIGLQEISPAPAPAHAAEGEPNRPRLVVQTGHKSILAAGFSPDGKRIVTGSVDKTARVWDADSGKELRQLNGHTDGVTAAGFSPDGKRIVTASEDGTARVWDADSGKELRQLVGHTEDVFAAGFSPDGKRIVTASFDKTARIWDAESGKELRQLVGHTNVVKVAGFSPDGKRVVTGSADKTARVWDAESGKELRRFTGHATFVRAAGFSPDGTRIVSGSEDRVARVWDADSGKELRQLTGHTDAVFAAGFSPDGKWIVTGSADTTARVWDAEAGREIRQLAGHADPVNAIGFSPDGKRIVTGSDDHTARVWNTESGKELRQLIGHTGPVWAAGFSPTDGKRIVTASYDLAARVWDADSGKQLRQLGGHTDGVIAAGFSPDGKRIVTASADRTARVWDADSGKQLYQLSGHTGPVWAAAFSSDGMRIVTASEDKTARVWDAESGKEIRQLAGHTEFVKAAGFSPDGKRIVTASYDNTARVWDADSGKEIRQFTGHMDGVIAAGFSPDGKRIVTGGGDGTARVWDADSGKELLQLTGHTDAVTAAGFSPDGKRIVTASDDKTARIWDADSGKELRLLIGHTTLVKAAGFSPDGKRIVTASDDKTARIWDAESGKELCLFVSFHDGSWAVVDPEGRYDASNGGDVDGLHWVVGNEPIDLSQLKQRYYDPGLLAKVVGHNKQPLRPVAAFKDLKMFPGVVVNLPANGGTTATIRLTNRGGGIGKVRVLVNGKELVADARGPQPNPEATEATLTVDLSAAINMIPGKPNRIEVIAYNAEEYLSSRGFEEDVVAGGEADATPPELYAIVCGISQYADAALNLRFAAKDAEDFAAALRLAGTRLFGADKVHLTLLTTTDRPDVVSPTKENIRKAFEAARKAKPGDVLVVYLAGHGTTRGGSDNYLYPTRDASGLDSAALADPALVEATTVSSLELTDWLLKIGANKKAMILDTCAAGAAAAKLTEKRAVDGDQERALDQLKDRTGFQVLMGCAADKVSYETSRFSQGLVTYSLLEGMKGAALPVDGGVDVTKLFVYSTDRVPVLAGNIGGVQRPLVIAPRGGQSFPIGRLTAEDQPKIALAAERPLVLRSNFQDEDELADVLGLGKMVDDRLRTVSARGRDAELVFVEAAEFPDAYRLAGRYKGDGETLTVTANVFLGKKKIGPLKASGPKDKPDEVAERVAHEMGKLIAEKR